MPQKLVDETSHQWFDRTRFSDSRALLVGTYQETEERQVSEEYLHELHELARTHGIQVVETLPLLIRTHTPSMFLSTGKLEEVREAVLNFKINLVIFDDDISVTQQKNLEKFLNVPVIDRTEVILGVFADRAQSREAKLQIEFAKVKYLAPRLKRMWTHFSKQAGGGGGATGGGYLKGEGEKQIEIDRRILKKRLEQLQKELKCVQEQRKTQRAQRARGDIPIFSIVGYTNAGKSTLMKALTQADVFIEDKLFATLDTTTRRMKFPETHQSALIIDTVGFIRKLPHLLVMAFKSTLEEAVHADVILHVIDAAHPLAPEHAAVALQVLKELRIGDIPVISVFNKMDVLQGDDALPAQRAAYQKLRLTYPRAIEISAIQGAGLNELISRMGEELRAQRVVVQLKIPQSEYHLVSKILEIGNIIQTEYEGDDVLVTAEVPSKYVNYFERFSQ